MAIKATVSIHKVRVEESLNTTLTRLSSFHSKYPEEFEEFIRKSKIKRALKILSSYLD